jgi:hypothetical protein
MAQSSSEFLSFEKIEIEGGQRMGHTAYACRIKSLLNDNVVELHVRVELPHSDRKLSEVEHEIATLIHKATDPTRLRR